MLISPNVFRGGKRAILLYDQNSRMSPLISQQLNDDEGLYSDSEGSWYRTNWDVMRVKVFQLSERFDEDDKAYYDSFMANFESGSPREGSASTFSWAFTSWDN